MSIQNNKPDTPCPCDCDLFVVPSRNYVKESIEEHAQSRNHPNATLQDKGFVVLSNDVGSDSETMAATPKAVKVTYNLANTANQNASNANDNANTRLAKDRNGADIPDKKEFVKNLGIEPLMEGLSLPVGVPVPWPTETPPEGWLICNGNSFDTVRYPKLALAYPSGVLPDLRGEFIRGWDNGRGIDPSRQILSWQTDAFARHNHNIKTTHSNITSNDDADPARGSIPGSVNNLGNIGEGKSIGMTGDNETRPRNIAFNYIVKAA